MEKNGGNLGGDDANIAKFSGPRFERYQQTKLANMVFTYALVDKLAAANKSKIKVMVAHPGVSFTALGQNMTNSGDLKMPFLMKYLFPLMAQTPADGAIGITKCCFDTEAKTGDFYGPGSGRSAYSGNVVAINPEDICTDEEAKKMLWELSETAVGESFDV